MFVERPAVGDDAAIGRSVAHSGGHEQRTVEPAAILVWSFEINVRGPLRALQHGKIRGAGIEPHIQNVVFLPPFCRAAGASCAGRKPFFRRVLVPRVGAFPLEPFHDVAERLEILEPRPAAFAIKNNDGHAPESLARDAPVGAVLDHFVDAFFTPGRNPLYVVDFFERFLAQRFFFSVRGLVHLDKPLFGGAEDHRVVAAPAMRVAVLVFVMAQKGAAVGEQFHDDGIRCENIRPPVFGQTPRGDAHGVVRRVYFQSIFLAGNKVVGAVAGGGVHDAAALVERDVVGKNPRHLKGQEGMLEFHAIEIASLEAWRARELP